MKKLLNISAVVMGLLVLTAGGILFFRLSQFRAEIASLKSQGHPVSFADLCIQPEEIEVDGTNTFNRLVKSLDAFEVEMFEDQEVLFRPVDEEMIVRFDELNQAYPDVYPLMEELARADDLSYEFHGDFQAAINEELDRVQRLRSCARLLQWKMNILAAQGKPDEALSAGLQIFQLCRVFDNQPTLVAMIVRVACQGIAISGIHELITTSSISDESRQRLNKEIEKRAASNDYLVSLITERATGIEYISQMGMFHLAASGMGYLKAIDEEIQNCTKQPFEQTFEFEEGYSLWMDGWAAGSVVPAFRQVRFASARTTSDLRALRIINELEFQPELIGQEMTQSYLVEIGVPEEMTVDPMTGGPMKVKRIDNRWVVYSVGKNLTDDCGDPNPVTGDFGLGMDEDE